MYFTTNLRGSEGGEETVSFSKAPECPLVLKENTCVVSTFKKQIVSSNTLKPELTCNYSENQPKYVYQSL